MQRRRGGPGAGAGVRGKGSIPFPYLQRTQRRGSWKWGDAGVGGVPSLLGPQSQALRRSSPATRTFRKNILK